MKKVLPTMVLLATVGAMVFAGGGAETTQSVDDFQPGYGRDFGRGGMPQGNFVRGDIARGPMMGYGYDLDAEALENQEPGIVITQVIPDTPAAEAGIQRGDILLTFNGTEVNSFVEIYPLLEGLEAGQSVDIGLTRAGQPMNVQVELETLLNAPLIGIMGQGQRPNFDEMADNGFVPGPGARMPRMAQMPRRR